MNKLFTILLIVAFVVIAYVSLLAINPVIVEVTSTAANQTDPSNFASNHYAIKTFPIWMWFIPGLCGVIGVVVTLKKNNTGRR